MHGLWITLKMREKGITIDLAFQKFETPKYFFTLIDAPGHRDFIKNMITGASEADCAVLVLSAKEGETDTAIAAGGQAREHAFLLKTLGVNQIIVAINKMDDSNYSEDAFNKAKEKGEGLIKSVGYKLDQVPFIPVSGWKGDNLVKKSENMGWYKGKTLSLKHLMTLLSQKNQLENHYVFQFKMFTQSLV